MGLFFIWMTLVIATIIVALNLQDIKIELKYRNSLMEDQNKIQEKILNELIRKNLNK
jgi:hypothetical protein